MCNEANDTKEDSDLEKLRSEGFQALARAQKNLIAIKCNEATPIELRDVIKQLLEDEKC